MRLFGTALLWLAIVCAVSVEPAWAQQAASKWPVVEAGIEPDRGPGWYFSLGKFALPLLIFFAWTTAVDWLSQDCQRLKLGWTKWNALTVFTFLGCFLLHYVIPGGFWVGFPLVLLGTLPVFLYVRLRNKSTTADDVVLSKDHMRRWLAEKLAPLGIKIKVAEKVIDVPIEINAQGGANAGEEKAVSVKLLAQPGTPHLKKLFLDAVERRANGVLLDYSQQGVAVKYQIDGVYQDASSRDRPTGDALLAIAKTAAFLNPAERVKRQAGKFEIKHGKARFGIKLTCQGTQTGERVLIQLEDGSAYKMRLDTLGMREKTQDELKSLLNTERKFVLVSAPPGRGQTALLNAIATGMDRFVRSVVGIESTKTNEVQVENVVLHRFDPDKGETPATILPTVFRLYPDAYVVPDLVDAKSAELFCNEVTDEKRIVVASIAAKEAAEALLRVLMLKVPLKTFVPVVSAVVCGRLVRKLCEDCRQAYTPPPQLLQQLRVPANRVTQLYRQYQPPPPDPKQKPAPPCAKCGGSGYHGRTGIYEFLVVDEGVRAALSKSPTVESVRQAAQKAGMHTLQEEAIMLVVQGVTSVEEISRVLKE